MREVRGLHILTASSDRLSDAPLPFRLVHANLGEIAMPSIASAPPTDRSQAKPSEIGTTLQTTPIEIAESDVAARAYELYCERGCEDGHDVDDWLRAEKDLAARRIASVLES